MNGAEINYNSSDSGAIWGGGHITINSGEISYNSSIGSAGGIDGVIAYDLSTNHNTAYLEVAFNSFKFTVNENGSNFTNFNFKPANGYVYSEGDEDKLVCLNYGYSTYWDTATGTFRLQADNQ